MKTSLDMNLTHNFERAIKNLKSFIKKFPDNPKKNSKAHLWLGQSLYETGHTDKAIPYLIKCINKYPYEQTRANAERLLKRAKKTFKQKENSPE